MCELKRNKKKNKHIKTKEKNSNLKLTVQYFIILFPLV